MVKQIGDIKMYSIHDLVKSLGLTERTIRGWFMTKKIKGVKLGKEWFISEDNLRRFLNAEEESKAVTLKLNRKRERKRKE